MKNLTAMLHGKACRTWMLALVYLLAMACAADASVLCYATDGHVALEAASVGDSCEMSDGGAGHASHPLPGTHVASSGHTPAACVDLPLAGLPDRLRLASSSDSRSPSRTLGFPLFLAPGGAERVAAGVAPFFHPAAGVTLRSLRATVLLV